MRPQVLIKNQFRQISTFLIILVLLFIVTIIFNLNYAWHGMSIIVKVYLAVFSFFLIFNISHIEITQLKPEYYKNYGKTGIYLLFLITRVFPILLIYICVIIYTIIDAINDQHWPSSPLLDLLRGKNSNIVFISLILLLILKLRKQPRITIPLFIAASIVHFIIYKSIYTVFPIGVSITAIKVLEYFIFLFFLIYEFNSDKLKIIRTVLYSSVIGVCLYFFLICSYYIIYSNSEFSSYEQVRTSQILFTMGYSFPIENYKRVVVLNNRYDLVEDLVRYSNQYKYPLELTTVQWEQLLKPASLRTADNLCKYFMRKKIKISYSVLINYIQHNSLYSGNHLLKYKYIIRYISGKVENNYYDILDRFKKGNVQFKLWTINVLAESGYYESIPFIISLLTDIDNRLTVQAYLALTRLTGIDPVAELNLHQNNPQVIDHFIRFYQKKRTRYK